MAIRASLWALLLGLQLNTALRVADYVYTGEPGDEGDEDACTTKLVTDGEECGMEEIKKWVKDAAKCGVEWCDIGPAYICPKSCWVIDTQPKSCELFVSCPVEIMMHVTANASTRNVATIAFETHLVNFSITTPQPELQQVLDSNRAGLLPWMQQLVQLGSGSSKVQLEAAVKTTKDSLVEAVGKDIVTQYRWTSLFASIMLGGNGFWKGLASTVSKRFHHIDLEMHPRAEVGLPSGEKDGDRLCHNILRIRTKGGGEYLESDWRNALVARKYDSKTSCSTAYTAHCGSGTFIKTKKCPLKEPEVTRSCMWSIWCWSRYRTIEATAGSKVATVFVGDQEVEATDDIWIDHVSPPKGPAAGKVVAAKALVEDEPQELDTLVEIKDDSIFEVMVEEICNEMRRNAWYGFGAIQAARCRVLLKTLVYLPKASTKLQVGNESVPVDIEVKSKEFQAELIPNWDIIQANAEETILATINEMSLPMKAQLKEVNLQMSGRGEKLFVEARPGLRGIIDTEMIEELRKQSEGALPK